MHLKFILCFWIFVSDDDSREQGGLYLANWITKMSPVGGAACEEEEGWCSKREDAIARRVKQLLLTTKESSEKLGNCSFRLVYKGRNLCQSEPAPTSVPSTGHPL